jgi:hypothetical protein
LGGAAWILSILCLFEEMKVKKVVASSEISESLLQKEEGKENVANLSSTYNENDDYNNDD